MKKIEGSYKVVDGKLDFVCHTEGVSFEEVKIALILVRDEINRQIENENKCPWHNSTGIVSNLELPKPV